MLTLTAVVAAYAHAGSRSDPDLVSLRYGTEDAVQPNALDALDGVSRTIAPALHSASLRIYLMVIVGMSVVGWWRRTCCRTRSRFRSAAHEHHGARRPGLSSSSSPARSRQPRPIGDGGRPLTRCGRLRRCHDFPGSVRPDPAMTQFSVETLTVLIYVLVFRHFAEPRRAVTAWCALRDLLIGAGVGTFIGGLLLSVATTETARRLREYFAEFGPTLGHGRNIVNVILVDFRGFDTIGEITVLATAAMVYARY